MFWHCKVCKEKENRIQDLAEQISLLRKLAYPELYLEKSLKINAEANAILDGIPASAPINPNIEVAALLTGSYENSQIEIEDYVQ